MSILSQADKEHFLEKGYVVVREAIPQENAAQWRDMAWKRLGYDPSDPNSWAKPRVHLEPSVAVRVEEFAPRAYAATCEVVGGADRIRPPYFWSDVFVCNFAEGADQPWQPPSSKSSGWHKDGYFFRHFLDSPEQGLLTIAAWTDVLSHGGGTFIAPDSVGVISRHLAAHPEGVSAGDFGALAAQCQDFVEITANAGDAVLLHPFMLHAVSQNELRRPRFITNPILVLKEPMQFDRPDGDYSLIEAATLHALGVERLDFKPTAPREGQIPDWVNKVQTDLQNTTEPSVLVG